MVSEAAKGEDIILEGAFENVQIDAPDVKISTQGDKTIKERVVRAVNVTQSENILTATTSPVGATVSYQWQKSDAIIELDRELKDGEEVKVNGKLITNADMDKGIFGRIINLSTLLNSTEKAAIDKERSYDIKIEDIGLNSGLYVVATPILTKDNDVVRVNGGTGLGIFTAGMKTYADSLEFTADNSSHKFTINYKGVTPQISGLSGYYSAVRLNLYRPLVTDESITLTLTGTGMEEKSVAITKEKLAEFGMVGQSINLSKLLDLPLN